VALVRTLSDNVGLTAGLSKALASRRVVVHNRGRVLADLACAIADGGEVISNFRVMADQQELFGLVASVPTCWRMLKEVAAGGAGSGPGEGGGERGSPPCVGGRRGPPRLYPRRPDR
jgi:hypothetical protein